MNICILFTIVNTRGLMIDSELQNWIMANEVAQETDTCSSGPLSDCMSSSEHESDTDHLPEHRTPTSWSQ